VATLPAGSGGRAVAAGKARAARPRPPCCEWTGPTTPSWNKGDPPRVRTGQLCVEPASWMETSRSNESAPPSYLPLRKLVIATLLSSGEQDKPSIRASKTGANTSTLLSICFRLQLCLRHSKDPPVLFFAPSRLRV
jgi:hypothetical protein